MPNVQNSKVSNCPSVRSTPRRARARRTRNSNQIRRQKNAPVDSRNTAPTAVKQVRTTDSITRALSSRMAQISLMDSYRNDPYACCRLMGVVPKESPSIPDGDSGRKICVCLYTIDTITNTTKFRLQMNTWLPYPVLMTEFDNNATVNGNAYAAGSATNTYPQLGRPATLGFGWGGTSQLRFSGNMLDDPWASTTARVVSQTHRLTYTGPTSTCAGLIQCYENQMSLNQVGVVTSAVSTSIPAGHISAITYGANGVAGGSGLTNPGFSQINTPIYVVDGNPYPTPPPNTLLVRPEQGVLVRLKHKGSDYEPRSMLKTLGVATTDRPTVSGVALAGTSVNSIVRSELPGNATMSQANGDGLLFYDNDWISGHIFANGLNPDASYALETCICMEFVPQAGSTFAPLASDKPVNKPGVIKHVEKTLATEGMFTTVK